VKVALVATGVANLASVAAAFVRLGAEPVRADTPAAIRAARAVVLPGNGTFGAAMAALDASGCADALRERVARERPLLAVCLGLQLLGEGSAESPGVGGLAVLPTTTVALVQRRPHLGFARITSDDARFAGGHAWYAHSYRLDRPPSDGALAWSEAGRGATRERFLAAFARGPLLACQFHPELSGPWGAALLAEWLR
jgi:imidazole glycerol phosphate synthase glutamine amidotransferase subunit